MTSSARGGDPPNEEIHLWREEDWWIAKDIETGVTTQARSRDDALVNRDETVALHNDEIGHEPTPEELRELGIEPADNTTGDDDPPDVLQ